MYIGYVTTREVKSPERGHPTDAGLDFFCPKIDEEFKSDFDKILANDGVMIRDNGKIVIQPGQNVVIPSGIKIEIPYGHMGLFLNKSGVATKMNVLVGAQVIDTFYSGEVHIDLHNVNGSKVIIIEEGMKLIQMIIVPVVTPEPTYIGEEDLYVNMRPEKYREESGFGSTDKATDKATS